MKLLSELLFGLFILFDTLSRGLSLQCWKCISDNCHTNPEQNINAVNVRCKDGEQCMKVQFKMFDNVTYFDSVIRTCTQNTCVTSSLEDFLRCLSTPKLYMIRGCSLSSCCRDRDLCNSGLSPYMITTFSVILIVLPHIIQ